MSAIDSEKVRDLIKILIDYYDDEDAAVRTYKIRRYRELKLYWNNLSNIYWSETAKDFRVIPNYAASTEGNSDQAYYDRPVNVLAAFCETIIAALSIKVPAVSCSPDDAESPSDQSTAKAGDKIAELIYKHNDVIYLWLKALYLWMTEGMVACHNYEKHSEKFGTYSQKEYKKKKQDSYVCPQCEAILEDSLFQSIQTGDPAPIEEATENLKQQSDEIGEIELNEFGPDDDDIELDAALKEDKIVCPECAVELDPNLQKSSLVIPRFIGETKQPKGRVCFDLFGELYVKVANYARTQADTPYLLYSYETHYSQVLEQFRDNDDLWDKLPKGENFGGSNDPQEPYARLNPSYRAMTPEDLVTVKCGWIRPSGYNILDREDSDYMHKHFPDGVKGTVVDEIVVDHKAENFDDCWTLTRNPLADFLSFEPYAERVINIQDTVNDLISLILQLIEHGIPQTWVDPAVVNVPAFGQLQSVPGTVTATKSQAGTRNIGEAFFTNKAAAVSPEIFQFYNIINQLGQFVSAAMPSIFGGSQDAGSSRTASEYALSRTASLQRLQTPWHMFTVWWKEIFGKAIPQYMKLVKEDEKFTKKGNDGSYINVWIRRAELTGKIGNVEIENEEGIPITDEQKAEWVMRLMELNNQEVQMALMSPENLPMIRKVIKLPEFKLPGEEDRVKQAEEIELLLQEEPIEIEPDPLQSELAMMQGMPPQSTELPSVEIDPLLDNHAVEAEVCRSYLISEAGRLAKVDNPNGYKNVMLHLQAHMQIVQQQQQQAAQAQAMQSAANNGNGDNANGNNAKGKPPQAKSDSTKKSTGEQIDGAEDVRIPVQ